MKESLIYLDNNATTRMDDKVLESMLPYFTIEYANPGSSHLFGLTVAEAIENATEETARLIGCNNRDIIFTSGATEAINLAMKGISIAGRNHIILAETEHKAVIDTAAWLEQQGYSVSMLEVNASGLIEVDELKATITTSTLLVCIMMANNETGVLQPIQELSSVTHEAGALFLCDATQAVGKSPLNVKELGIDFMPFSAHKFYGPKGIGALYVAPHAKKMLVPQMHGGGHQQNRRSGTLNVPGIIGLGKACEIAEKKMAIDAQKISALRDKLEKALLQIDGAFINGDQTHRLYNTSSLCFPGINSEKLITALQNIAVSNGSACSAVTSTPSHVLKSMGLSDADALASIRFSLGRFTTEKEIDITIEKVKQLVIKMRS